MCSQLGDSHTTAELFNFFAQMPYTVYQIFFSCGVNGTVSKFFNAYLVCRFKSDMYANVSAV